MDFTKIKYKSTFVETKPLCDWLACLHVYKLDPHALDQNKSTKFIKANLTLVSETLQNQIPQWNCPLSFTITKQTTTTDFHYNMYRNIADNAKIREQLQQLLEINKALSICINLDTNLVRHIFESNRTNCADEHCKGKLKRVFRSNETHKGSISVAYHSIGGPELAISYRKSCTGCKSTYYHGYYETKNGDTILEELSQLSNFYQSTECTFFDFNAFLEYREWRFNHGVSPEGYCDIYNMRHAHALSTLKSMLGDRSVGRRVSSDLKLESNRFDEAWHLFELQMLTNDDLNEQFIITNQMKTAALQRNKSKVHIHHNPTNTNNKKSSKNGMQYTFICIFIQNNMNCLLCLQLQIAV